MAKTKPREAAEPKNSAPTAEKKKASPLDEPATLPARGKLSRFLTSAVVRCLGAAVAIFAWSFFLAWFVQCAYAENSVAAGWEFISTHASVFWYSVLIMALWLTLASAVFRSTLQAGGITWAILIVASFANSAKLAAREIPLLPEDLGLLGEAGSLMQFVDPWDIVRIVCAVILLLVITTYGGIKIRRAYRRWRIYDVAARHKKLSPAPRVVNFIIRFVVVGLSFYALVLTTEPIRHHDGSRYYHVDWLNTTFTAWNAATTYTENGFILGYLYNLEKYRLVAPPNYSAEAIEWSVDTYQAAKVADSPNRTPLSEANYNIIVVLNESFYDLANLADFYTFTNRATGEVADLTPNLHRLQATSPHGQMFSIDIGGGTANVEFEALTGLTNYWVNTVPYTDLISSLDQLPSIASWLQAGGYATTAMHSFNGGMYKRNLVYPIMGFSQFYDVNTLPALTYRAASHYVDDGSLYQAAIDTIAASDQKQLISLVTMQNHTPYDIIPSDNTRFALADPASASSPANQLALENYAQTLNDSDAYLGELAAAIDALDEPTVLLFYGDHAPGIFDAVFNSDQRYRTYQTPYLIYANFDLTGATPGQNLGMISPNCLTSRLYDTLGLEKPAYAYLLADVCASTPVLAHTYGQDDAIETAFQESAALQAYQMATYDLLGGEQYWLKLGGFSPQN